MLASMNKTVEAGKFIPHAAAKTEARRRFNAALAELQRTAPRSFLSRLSYWPFAVATAVAMFALAIWSYGSFQPGLSPVTPAASPQGNFVFQISDAVNAIADFSSVNVTITKIGILSDSGWIEFAPEISTVDLVKLPGEKTQVIWRGDMPDGDYRKVFVYVSNVQGVLKSGQVVDIKLPGNKLQINNDFSVSADAVTSFTFDITVKATGNPKHDLKYQLSPQADQSGASKSSY
jgi:hypothetical protein